MLYERMKYIVIQFYMGIGIGYRMAPGLSQLLPFGIVYSSTNHRRR